MSHSTSAPEFSQNLNDLRLLRTAAESVAREDLVRIEHALHALRPGVRPVDTRRRLRRVATAEGRLVEQDDVTSMLKDGVGGRNAGQATADHNRLRGRKHSRHPVAL